MRTSRLLTLGALGLAAALTLSACSGTSGSGTSTNKSGSSTTNSSSSGTIGKVDGHGKTLTVWAMQGDLSDENIAAINKKFEEETGAKVKVDTQQWTDIATKITTALATSTPPDVLDIGNTQVSTFAATGGLMDITQYKKDLEQGQTWLGGLVDPATIDGKLYGVPSFGAARAAIYNKDIWKAAGVTDVPTTYDQLQQDLDKIKAANADKKNFSAFYLPGTFWYAGMQWVWDAGGEIATQANDKWTAGFSTPEAQKGLEQWKAFQNKYSAKSSDTVTEAQPDESQVFAGGNIATMIGNASKMAAIVKDNPKMTDSVVGTFPMPGASGQNQPTLLAGSDWGIAQKSPNKMLALAWAKIAASPAIQLEYYPAQGWTPNSVEAVDQMVQGGKISQNAQAFVTAAKRSKATPAAGGWAPLEDPGIRNFFKAVTTGTQSVKAAAASWDATVNKALNSTN